MAKKSKRLPVKMSSLITVALEDLRCAEKSKKYEINMDNWHVINGKGKCEVCFAGSVMACRLGVKSTADVLPSEFDGKTMGKLYALDSLRSGDVGDAYYYLSLTGVLPSKSEGFQSHLSDTYNRDITPYYEDPTEFKNDMKRLAHDLKKGGL